MQHETKQAALKGEVLPVICNDNDIFLIFKIEYNDIIYNIKYNMYHKNYI